MCTSPKKNIDIHLPGRNEQGIGIAGWDYSMAMGESNTETSMRHNFGQGEIWRVDIEITFDEL